MARIVRESPDPRKTRHGRAECRICKTVFEFDQSDTDWEPGFLGIGEAYVYLTCPAGHCHARSVLIEYRIFGPLWRLLFGPRKTKLVPPPRTAGF